MAELHGIPIGKPPKLPDTLLIGNFKVTLEAFSDKGIWNAERRQFDNVSGTAWLMLSYGNMPVLPLNPVGLAGSRADNMASSVGNGIGVDYALEVVAKVTYPQTQIGLEQAEHIQPGIQIGQTLQLSANLEPEMVQKLAASGLNLIDWWVLHPPRSQILLGFQNVTIRPTAIANQGRIVAGKAQYPADSRIPFDIRFTIDGFTLDIKNLTLTPGQATADITLELPVSLTDAKSCSAAGLSLGEVVITPALGIYVDEPKAAFGPWIIGDTGLVMEGRGFVFDLSPTVSPLGYPPAWKGLLLRNGKASGASLVPEPANTAYLRGDFSFNNAILTAAGLDAELTLSAPHMFITLDPLGYRLEISSGRLILSSSQIISGDFGPGQVTLPKAAVCKKNPGNALALRFQTLAVQPNLDLTGEVDCSGGVGLSWGQLTQAGPKEVIWDVTAKQGFLYLPANPFASYCPDTGGAFIKFYLSFIPSDALAQMASYGVTGLALGQLSNLVVYSPDRPGGVANPLRIPQLIGWLRVGLTGLDGEINTYEQDPTTNTELGNPARVGYVGKQPFRASLADIPSRLNLVGQYVSSAVYDSRLAGTLNIPYPCDISALAFHNMKFTSTAHLVGGDVALPAAGVCLKYWDLQVAPTGNSNQAGVISVRTGRVIFTAAGIAEPRHFAKPFALIWGEILADGNLGDLSFDYNNYGQRFDNLPYDPANLLLSTYDPAVPDPYLATCGTVHFNYFGAHYVNIHDARDGNSAAPFFNRKVTCPKTDGGHCGVTDLHLSQTWYNDVSSELAIFEFPDINVDYNQVAQDGFIGSGTTNISFFHSDGLDTAIEIHGPTIDLRFSSQTSHDIDLGLITTLSGMSQISGCGRIEGPCLERIEFYGLLETSSSVGTGIIEPKTGEIIEINIVATPTSFDFSAAGDMLMQVAGAAVDLTAMVHLFLDFAVGSAEGELVGRIDASSVLGGLEGDGQVTWHIGPDMQYVQGRMKVFVCGWLGGGGMEGGFFVGSQVPKAIAWVLHTGSPHFGLSDAILPDTLTGLYGYGMLATSVNWYIFGGGVEVYAGMGAFSLVPPGQSGLWDVPGLGLPYVLGSCGIYVHGDILGGLVSASAWANLSLRGPIPIYFEGTFGLEGCALWVACTSTDVTAGINSSGFYMN